MACKWAKVAIDDTKSITAYLNPDNRWNGFARPYFRKEDARLINDVLEAIGDEQLVYDERYDRFDLFDGRDRIEWYYGVDIDGMHLYPIGAGSWVWLEED